MLDHLLNNMHNVYYSEELMLASVWSSTSKLIPKFLGQLCLVEKMDEIDQQIIHYLHPLAVSLILVIINLLARWSYKLSVRISFV